MSIVVKHNALSKAKQVEKEYFVSWEKRLKATQTDLMKRQRELEERCTNDINLLKTYKAKLRKFNYQLSICEVLGLDRIDRIQEHLNRKIIQYNECCKVQTVICESDKVDMAFILKEHIILNQERSQFYKEKQVFNKSKYSKV